MDHFDLVRLTNVMELTEGRSDILVGLIDGPIDTTHPNLTPNRIRPVIPESSFSCFLPNSDECQHGTLVAGVLFARRGCGAPSISPGCTFLVRPIFTERPRRTPSLVGSTLDNLATAIVETVKAGARVINLSCGIPSGLAGIHRSIDDALDFAARKQVVVVVAAGNQSSIGGSILTRHSWVIPVVSCDEQGMPTSESNLGSSIGRRGLTAPGKNILSLGSHGRLASFSGTSAACAFVTGALALLWSAFPRATAIEIRTALAGSRKRKGVVPPLLDAWRAYQLLAANWGLAA